MPSCTASTAEHRARILLDRPGQQSRQPAHLVGPDYFSFTVLTSTGFGEITPVTPMARRSASLARAFRA
ncbi:potassium channel family protein [Reyranella sp.]|uniref:potassium channel family protein n=1 Tax=Reyranella sp. TaxID=1929291 RepID=UPI00342CE362